MRSVHDDLVQETSILSVLPSDFNRALYAADLDLLALQTDTLDDLTESAIIQQIRSAGCRAGVAINPATLALMVEPVIDQVDLVLVMTVNPGFGGQAFIESAARKATRVRAMAMAAGLENLHVQVDGGIDARTAPGAARAGADVLVAGSAVFRGPGSVEQNYASIRRAIDAADAPG